MPINTEPLPGTVPFKIARTDLKGVVAPERTWNKLIKNLGLVVAATPGSVGFVAEAAESAAQEMADEGDPLADVARELPLAAINKSTSTLRR